MAKYVVCEACKELIEYNPASKYEGGTTYITTICPKCGYKKTITQNNIHYGEDGLS